MDAPTVQIAGAEAVKHFQAGRLTEAERLCRQILQEQPGQSGALRLIGLIAHQQGRSELALDFLRKAMVLDPAAPELHYNLGVVLKATGQLDQAIAEYRRAIELRADYPAAYNNLGIAFHENGALSDAIAAFRSAIFLRPNRAQGHSNLADALMKAGQIDDAIAEYRLAIAMQPDYAQAYNNLANALRALGQLDEAILNYHSAIRLQPADAELHSNLGNALKDKGLLDVAIVSFEQAVALRPDSAEFHGNLALALLLSRRFKDGWREYEWRWQAGVAASLGRAFDQPRWDGSPLAGRTLLVHAEQGFGDTIQFARYVPLLAKRGGEVIFQCAPELLRLMQRVAGLELVMLTARTASPWHGRPARVSDSEQGTDLDMNAYLTRDSAHTGGTPVPRGASAPPNSAAPPKPVLPPFDVQASLMSLPLLLDMPDPSDALVQPPYIHLDDQLRLIWRERIGRADVLKIGLAWAGSPHHPSDARRSIPFAELAPLLDTAAIFYSLQFGDAARQCQGSQVIDLTGRCADFLDTAALIAELDLIVTVDTAVAHLAGAMAKTVWVLLPYAPDWRWQLGRDDSPWYPSIKLFRQQRIGDWSEVIARVAKSLQQQI